MVLENKPSVLLSQVKENDSTEVMYITLVMLKLISFINSRCYDRNGNKAESYDA